MGPAPPVPDSKRSTTPAWLLALRPHQWTKNFLVFVPLILAHVFLLQPWISAALIFTAMCFASSAAYLVNDLLDRKADRLHPLKRFRPIASGQMQPGATSVLAALLGTGSLVVASLVSSRAAVAVGSYIVLTLVYSLWLKRVLALDVFLLTTLYCLRILTGGIASQIVISPWTLSFSMFLFLSLALMKRYAELHNSQSAPGEPVPGRGYVPADMPIISSLGVASATTAALVIALYVNGDDVRKLYGQPDFLWLICLVVLLWMTRLWLLTNRGSMNEDPVLYAVQDPWSLLSGFAVGVVIMAAL